MLFCTKCGQQVAQFDLACTRCGARQHFGNRIPECVLVEDEEENTRQLMSILLLEAGYECRVADTRSELVYLYGVLPRLDLVCCSMSSLDSINKANRPGSFWPPVPVITSIPALDSNLITEIQERGGYDFVFRSMMREQLVFLVRRSLQFRRLRLENLYFRNKLHIGSGIELSLRFLSGDWKKPFAGG